MTTENKLNAMFAETEKDLIRLRKRTKGLKHYIIKVKRRGYEELLNNKTLNK